MCFFDIIKNYLLLTFHSSLFIATYKVAHLAERVGFEPTVDYSSTPIFETGTLNQLRHLSIINLKYQILL